jgi:hypothetical protein
LLGEVRVSAGESGIAGVFAKSPGQDRRIEAAFRGPEFAILYNLYGYPGCKLAVLTATGPERFNR